MRNFKLTIEYDGTGFNGWQIQNNGERTVQGELNKAALIIFKHNVKAIASGRTDSGVHAQGQVVSFKADTRMKPLDIQRALNSRLPMDIAVIKVEEKPQEFHAQYSVKEKTYRYTILNRKFRSAFLRNHALYYPHQLNLTWMRKAAKVLVGKHDFKSFQAFDKLRADKSTIRTIKRITIRKREDIITIDITADGFLYKMVRNIMGCLLSIGSAQRPLSEMSRILKSKDRTQAPETAPAHALTLLNVKY